jgi:hypothetical protein
MAERKFVIALRDLNLTATDRDPIVTQLTRTDFERAASQN